MQTPTLPFPPRPARRAFTVHVRLDDAEAQRLTDELLALARRRDPHANVAAAVDPPWTDLSFVAIDVETTGFSPDNDRVIEVAWVRFERGREVERFASLVHIDQAIPDAVRRITGITNAMLDGKPRFADIAPGITAALAHADFAVAYNARFDRGFLGAEHARARLPFPDVPWVDPLAFIRDLDDGPRRLADAAKRFGVACPGAHRAENDARATGELLLKLAPRIPAKTLADLVDKQERWTRLPQPTPEPRTFGAKLMSLFR